jgi:hypothetical protein
MAWPGTAGSDMARQDWFYLAGVYPSFIFYLPRYAFPSAGPLTAPFLIECFVLVIAVVIDFSFIFHHSYVYLIDYKFECAE